MHLGRATQVITLGYNSTYSRALIMNDNDYSGERIKIIIIVCMARN